MDDASTAQLDDLESERRRLEGRIAELRVHLKKLDGPPGRAISPGGRSRRLLPASILTLVLFLCGWWSLNLAGVALFSPDERVFVAREGKELQVWDSASSYEAFTGHKWYFGAPQDREFMASYHGERRKYALNGLIGLAIIMAGLVLALRRMKKADVARPPSTASSSLP